MDSLKKLGLSDNEILTYTTLLRINQASAIKISEISGVKKSTTYDNLFSLKEKGLVSTSHKEKVRIYQATSPDKILDYETELRKSLEEDVQKLSALAGEFKENAESSFFEGKNGVKMVINDILQMKQDLYFIGARSNVKKLYSYIAENFIERRKELKIRLRGLFDSKEKEDSSYSDKEIKKLTEFRYLDNLSFTFSVTFIYGDKVAFITTKGRPYGILVKSEIIAEQQKFLFQELWKNAIT